LDEDGNRRALYGQADKSVLIPVGSERSSYLVGAQVLVCIRIASGGWGVDSSGGTLLTADLDAVIRPVAGFLLGFLFVCTFIIA